MNTMPTTSVELDPGLQITVRVGSIALAARLTKPGARRLAEQLQLLAGNTPVAPKPISVRAGKQ